ncbi:MAG: molybdopterin-binding protein [Clostridia bacterium]|nr:molybdopterin-binding protein [Clostridia bacterium]
MFNVKSVDEVFEIIKNYFGNFKLENEVIDIEESVGRILAVDVCAGEDVPAFNRSSVDGYAVIASDTFGASDSLPAQLKLGGEVKMGEKPDLIIEKGHAAYIPTGGELPENADSVVMIEYTEDFKDGYIYINKASAPGNNVVFKGDDVKVGSAILKPNRRLRPQDVGALAAMGYEQVEVKKKIKVAIISTGDEVVDINDKVIGAKVRDINSYALYAGLKDYGAEPVRYGIVGDDYGKIRGVVEKALDECDIVLVSGGSSVGTKDETYNVINSFGEPGVLVHGIAVKPGKPTIIGKVRGKAVVGLPGHPASAYMIFRVFVGYLLDVINGSEGMYEKRLRVEMAYNYPSNNGREEFMPVRLEREGSRVVAHPVFGKSGLITLLTTADGYVRISRGSEGIASGEEVEAILF